MHTVKSLALDEGILSLSGLDAADRAQIAHEHAALFPTRLALARLASGAGLPHLHEAAGAHAPLRAAWLAEAQRNFQAWLDNGGFAQEDASSSGKPPSTSADTAQDNACVD